VPARRLARGLVVEVPFVRFALLLPVVARGPRVEVLGLSLSESGLRGRGRAAGQGDAVGARRHGARRHHRAAGAGARLQRLRLPALLVQILSFMVRYADVVGGELRRMRVARESRGFRGRGPGRCASWHRRRCAVRALLRARRAGAPGDAVAGVHRPAARRPAAPCPRRRGWSRWPAPCRRRGARGGDAARVSTAPVPARRGPRLRLPDGHQALFGVDLRSRGERVRCWGPNGAGKTTLVLHLNGILTGGRGRVSVAGLPVERRNLPEVRRRVGIVFQDPDDQLFMPTVGEDVAFGPRNLGLPEPEVAARVAAALAQVGMAGSADRPPHHLSFGSAPGRRRHGAVDAPEVLVLDEPSSNLDPPAGVNWPRSSPACGDHADGHPRPALRLQLCPRSVVLDGGVVVADGADP
jgi:cobalt/nickel transport system ATP-binding protein